MGRICEWLEPHCWNLEVVLERALVDYDGASITPFNGGPYPRITDGQFAEWRCLIVVQIVAQYDPPRSS
jgi:hypothetical protein